MRAEYLCSLADRIRLTLLAQDELASLFLKMQTLFGKIGYNAVGVDNKDRQTG